MEHLEAGAGHCVFCNGQISVETDYNQVQGWARGHRAEGGTNAIRLKEPTDKWACAACVDKQEVKGITIGQTVLI